jgi:hypothetical protein
VLDRISVVVTIVSRVAKVASNMEGRTLVFSVVAGAGAVEQERGIDKRRRCGLNLTPPKQGQKEPNVA